jgi:hypothetical protein
MFTQSSAAATTQQDHPHACPDSFVDLCYMAHDEDSREEVEFKEVLPCRHCALEVGGRV